MSPLSQQIKTYAATLGAHGQINLARLTLKLGKKLDATAVADDTALRKIALEVFGKSF
jgi:hypothetical protein